MTAAIARSTDRLGGVAQLNRGSRATRAKRSLAEFLRQSVDAGEIEGIRSIDWGPHLELNCREVQLQLESWLVAYGLGTPDMVDRQREAWKRTGATWEDGEPEPWLRYVLVQNALDNLPPGTLKPCYVNGLVVEKFRGVIRLADISAGDFVLTHKGRYRRVVATADQGTLPTLVIVTQRGRRVRVAGDHPMLTARGWVRADQVTTSDVLAEVMPREGCGTQTISPSEARVIGYLVGDGRVKGEVSFTNQNVETLNDFKSCVESLGFDTRVRSRRSAKHGDDVYCLSIRARRPTACACGGELYGRNHRCRRCQDVRNLEASQSYRGRGRRRLDPEIKKQRLLGSANGAVRRWCDGHGLWGTCSYDKRVPPAIMSGTDEIVAEYLAAYWSCDGGISERNDLRVTTKGRSRKAVRVDAVTVSGGLARDHQILLQRLGLSFTLTRQELKITSKRQGTRYVVYRLAAYDQDTAAKFMDVVGSRMRHEKRTRLPGIARADFDRTIRADKVVAIEPAGAVECRCLQVDEDSSFVYQGVAVHNSTVEMVAANAWIWLWCSWFSFGASSGNDANVKRDSLATRSLVQSAWYRETFAIAWTDIDVEPDLEETDEDTGVTIRHDENSVSDWATSAGGRRISRTVGRGFTGVHVDGLYFDDPDDADRVYNESDRLKPQNRYSRAMRNRINCEHRSLRRVLQQRVHPEDFTAYLLSLARWSPDRPKGWAQFCVPARFGYGPEDAPAVTPFGSRDWRTETGQLIHPRITAGTLADNLTNLGAAGLSAQYDQNPKRMTGGWFGRRFARFFVLTGTNVHTLRRRPDGCLSRDEAPPLVVDLGEIGNLTATVDAMNSLDPKPGGKTSAVGLGVGGCRGEERFLIDDRTRELGPSETYWAIYDLMHAWLLERLLIEEKALGVGAIDEITRAIRRGWYIGRDEQRVDLLGPKGEPVRCVVERHNPGRDSKQQRAHAMIPSWEQGKLLLLDGADWLYPKADENRKALDEGVFEEICLFPGAKRNDRIDYLSQFVARYRGSRDTREEWRAMRRLAAVGARGR